MLTLPWDTCMSGILCLQDFIHAVGDGGGEGGTKTPSFPLTPDEGLCACVWERERILHMCLQDFIHVVWYGGDKKHTQLPPFPNEIHTHTHTHTHTLWLILMTIYIYYCTRGQYGEIFSLRVAVLARPKGGTINLNTEPESWIFPQIAWPKVVQ